MYRRSASFSTARFFAAGAVLSATAGSAFAGMMGTIDMKYVGKGLGQSVRIDVSGTATNVFAGELLFQTMGATGSAELFDSLTLPTFCVEPTQYVQSNWHSYTVSDPDAAATPMMNLSRASALNSAVAYFYGQRALGAIDNAGAAGFQVALWEIMRDYDGAAGRSSLDLTSGTFKSTQTNGSALTASVANWASQFFDVATSDSFDGAQAFVFSNATSQDQIVPTPGGITLACVGFFVATRRRRG